MLFFFFGLGLIFIYLFLRDNFSYPKNHRSVQEHDIQRPSGDNRTQRFKRDQVPTDIDVIIIGSGISGLSCGAALAKNGKKVLVLEKHNIAGGSIHVFPDLGIEFDTGFHYTGNIEKRMPLLNFLGNFPIEWEKMGSEDREIFDRFYIGDEKYFSRAGLENLISDLSGVFPSEEENIRRYLEDVQKYAQKDLFFEMKIIQNPILRWLVRRFWGTEFFEKARMSSYEYVSQFTSDPKLIEVLCALSVDGGPPPRKQSSFIHASIVNHFLNGGYYPKGGPKVITQSLIQTIEKSGGRVFVSAPVQQILTDHGKVQGVRLEDQNVLYCKKVISSVGIPNTYQKLLLHNSDMDAYISRIPSSTTYFFLFVCLEGTAEELGLQSCNSWIWEDRPFDEICADFEKDPLKTSPIIFMASNSAKDSTWNERYPGKSAMSIIAWSHHSVFAEFQDEEERSSEYLDRKEIFEKKLLESMYRLYPSTKDKIIKMSSGTSLTVEHYLNSVNGACYGMDANLERFGDHPEVRPQTRIPGLYLTGQDITTLGFTGSLMSGILTANAVEGYGTLLDIWRKREFIKELMFVEKKDS